THIDNRINMLDQDRTFVNTGAASCTRPQRALADPRAGEAHIAFRAVPIFWMRTQWHESLVACQAVANMQNYLLRVRRSPGMISGAGCLAAPTCGTGMTIQELEDAEIGDFRHAELLDFIVVQVEFGKLSGWFFLAENHVERTVNDVFERRVQYRGDKDEDLEHMEPPQHAMGDQDAVQVINTWRTRPILGRTEQKNPFADPVGDDGILPPPEFRAVVSVHVAEPQPLDQQARHDEEP